MCVHWIKRMGEMVQERERKKERRNERKKQINN
jgi:hypothetical protein